MTFKRGYTLATLLRDLSKNEHKKNENIVGFSVKVKYQVLSLRFFVGFWMFDKTREC